MSDIKVLAAEAALQKMLKGGHFSICTIDKIVDMLSIKPAREEYDILRTLHCVDYNQMQPELLEHLPTLIMRVLDTRDWIPVVSISYRTASTYVWSSTEPGGITNGKISNRPAVRCRKRLH